MKKSTTLYKGHRFSPEIIQYAGWLNNPFSLRHRELVPDTIHDTSQYANNRAELSHHPSG